ncbi:hypothetical protein QR680_017106 [Steinernema hermaphroditum]|uniref:Uncharacterized protein n=1 Tax=Steinernema hermaphroditum TaxID=289476 RepID=A0AA39HDB1_9BILA|nr:hypothetical protein QR680_017106 [Steinernema hermaphroditum]
MSQKSIQSGITESPNLSMYGVHRVLRLSSLFKMLVEYLKSLQGLITVLQVLLGVVCQFVIQFMWNSGGDVFLVFFIMVNPFMTIVFFLLFACTMVTLAAAIMESKGSPLRETFGKPRVVMFRAVFFLLLLICAAIQTYYLVHTYGSAAQHYARSVIGAVLLYPLSLSHAVLCVLEILRRG